MGAGTCASARNPAKPTDRAEFTLSEQRHAQHRALQRPPRRGAERPGIAPPARRGSRQDSEAIPLWEDVRVAVPEGVGNPILLSRDALFRRSLALADVAGAYVALLLAALVVGRHAHPVRPTAVLIAPFVVVMSKMIGLYDRDQHLLRKTTIDELPKIMHLSVLYALGTWMAEQFLLHGWLARPQVLGLALGTFVFVTLGRAAARRLVQAVTPPERCIVIGDARDATRTAQKLDGARGVKATIVGRIRLHPGEDGRGAGMPLLGDLGALADVILELQVDRAIIAPASVDEEQTLHTIRLLKALGIKVSVLPRLLEVVGSSSAFDEIDGITLLGVRHYGLSQSSALLKRGLDIAGAGIGVVLLSPLFLILALLIKLDSHGPVFFQQPRIGQAGRRFAMLKFRSMVRDADRIKDELRRLNEAQGGLFKITNDPRVTRVGRLLRSTSLDELPQLLNVVAGHMSLVGPRPLVPDEDMLIEGWQRRRLAVKPGMTGLWQIFGSSRIPMPEMVKIDYLYGANWSLWLDLKILLRTIPYVLHRRGM